MACCIVQSVEPAAARLLEVGPTRAITHPSAALASAEDGDTIAIDAGEYYDCLRVRTPNLTIEGTGTGAVLTDVLCDGKASVVVQANDITLRNLTLTRIRAPDGNGAGIRAEGRNLTVAQSRFINNQSGILAASVPGSTIIVTDSRFERDGVCNNGRCVAAILVGDIARLRIERSVLSDTRMAHQISSSAAVTELIGNTIEDGPQGSASFQVEIPGATRVLMEDNIFEKGPNASNISAAVVVAGGAWGSDEPLVFRRNVLRNNTGHAMPFILNWTGETAVLDDNKVAGGDWEISKRGTLRHRLGSVVQSVRAVVSDTRRVARASAHRAVDWLRGR